MLPPSVDHETFIIALFKDLGDGANAKVLDLEIPYHVNMHYKCIIQQVYLAYQPPRQGPILRDITRISASYQGVRKEVSDAASHLDWMDRVRLNYEEWTFRR